MDSWNRAEQPVTLHRNGWHFKLAPHLSADDFTGLLDSIDTRLAGGDVLKDSKTTTAAICTLPDIGRVFLKRTNNKGLRFTLRYLFRRARSFRAADAANALIQAGIETPAVLAVGEHRTGPYLHAGYIINETREDARCAHLLLARSTSPGQMLDSLIEKAAGQLSLIHSRNIVHGDYKLSNIYLTAEDEPGTWDLDGAAILGAPSRKRMFADLLRFVFSLRQVLTARHPEFILPDQELCRKAADCYAGPFPVSADELCAALRNRK